MKLIDKQALKAWEQYRKQIKESTFVDINETLIEQKKRIAKLEADHEEWFKYYFPKYAYAEPADFHKKSSKFVINNPEFYLVRSWSRELSKSTRTMFEVLYLMLTKRKKYMLLISNSESNAVRLLMPYMANLEFNQRIINDYGVQKNIGNWESIEFITKLGFGFRALGIGQSPRGAKNEEVRPDIICFDDLDTDEDCRNPETIKKNWKWIDEAAIGTRSISQPTLIMFNGNIIAKDCCVVRAQEFADRVEIINIRDEEGNSTWPQKNTEAHIDRVLSQKSYSAQQKEYYNNPIEEGTTFKEVTYGKCPSIKLLPFIVVYADPSTSNKDKPAGRSTLKNSCKAVVIVGSADGIKFFVYKCYIDVTRNSVFVDWLFAASKYIKSKSTITQQYIFIENNSLQDPFYQQVFKPLIYQRSVELKEPIGITPDERVKPDKFFRVEGELEPLNRNGLLILNEEEKEEPNMKRLEAQFKAVAPGSKTMDGPDAVEGAVFIIKEKFRQFAPGAMVLGAKRTHTKKF